jgi:hypothetical protein
MLHRFFWMAACLALVCGGSARAGTAEDWTNISTGNTGTFADSQGSTISYAIVDGPKSGEKAIKIAGDQKEGGWCGIWHNVDLNMAKANAVKFMAKADGPCSINISLTDANKMQYLAVAAIPSKDWTEVTIPISAFAVNPYYTPDGAIKGKPLDLSHVQGLSPGASGPGVFSFVVGPLTYTEGAALTKADVSNEAAKNTAVKGVTVILQDFGIDDPKIGGAWKDDKGSKIAISYTPAKKKDNPDDKAIVIDYDLAQGGWCGVWYRAGDDPSWGGVDLSSGKVVAAKVFATKPLEFGVSLEDANKVKYDASFSAAGGKWETLSMPMAGFPAAFTSVKTFNIYMKTPGEAKLSIDQIAVVK